MAEHTEWTNRPPLRSQNSQQSFQSIIRRPLVNSPMQNTPHRRTTSDNVSIGSRSQIEGITGLSRHVSSVSAKSRPSEPVMGTTSPHSPPMPSPPAWSDAGDLGSRLPADATSPDLSPDLNTWMQQKSRPPTLHHSPSTSTSAPRSRPAPMHFEDTSYISPVPSSASAFSPFGRFGPGRTDSRTNLINTPSTGTQWRSPRTPPTYWTKLQGRKRWFIWKPAWYMYAMFLLGFAMAIGHHAFYQTLDGRPAENQLAMLRYGAMFAFATKACLVSAVIVAYRQRIWTTVRSKMLSVAALDSLFAATEDFFALWNLEVYKQAKIAITLAILVWLAPLVIILTGNTLSVELAFRMDKSTCPNVRTLNFAMEAHENWRDPTKIGDLIALSVSLWNSTTVTNTSEGWYDYYTGYSDQFEQIARSAAYGKQVVGQTGATVGICGPGWNCTYVANFTAPGYKCEELAKGVGSKIGRFRDHKPPKNFNTTILLPEGSFSYYAYTSGGDYEVAQMKEVEIGGMPKKGPPFPKNLGAFRTEPILWIGYSERVDPSHIPSRSDPGWDEAFIPKIFACENYETTYTVHFNHTGGQQFTEIIDRTYLNPIIDTQWLQGQRANDGTNDNTTAYPETNYVFPNEDKEHYRRVAAFHSIGSMVRFFVNGTVNSETVSNPIAVSKAVQTTLLDRHHEWFPYPDLMRRVQSFAEDVVLSLLSDPQFLSVVWAARPDAGPSGVSPADNSSTTQYPCVRSRFENRYRYHTSTLWAVYGVAMIVAAIGIWSGTRAVGENDGDSGRLRDTRFSSIVAATRGPALEKVGWGGSSRWTGDPAGVDLPPDIKSLKVGYGLVHGGAAGGGGGAASSAMTTPRMSNNALGVTNNNNPMMDASPRLDTPGSSIASGFQHHDDEAQLFPERALWEARDVRYGFGLEGDVSQLRSEGSLFRGRSRA